MAVLRGDDGMIFRGEPIAPVNLMRYGWLGITDWQEAGYTGKGVKVCVIDADTDISLARIPEKITAFRDSGRSPDWTIDYGYHGLCTLDIIQQIMPDADTVFASWRYSVNDIIEWCILNDVDIVTASLSYSYNPLSAQLSEKAVSVGIKMVSSAGNDGAVPENLKGYPARKKTWVAIGAGVVADYGEFPYRLQYSSIGEDLEVLGMTHLFVQMPAPFYEMLYTGTSCSSPVVASMIGLIQEREGTLDTEEFRKLLIEHCIDIGSPGRDKYSGWGMLRMPSARGDRIRETVLEIDNRIVRVDGLEEMTDQAPFIVPETGRTMVPLSFIGRAMGLKVIWDEENRRVIVRG